MMRQAISPRLAINIRLNMPRDFPVGRCRWHREKVNQAPVIRRAPLLTSQTADRCGERGNFVPNPVVYQGARTGDVVGFPGGLTCWYRNPGVGLRSKSPRSFLGCW